MSSTGNGISTAHMGIDGSQGDCYIVSIFICMLKYLLNKTAMFIVMVMAVIPVSYAQEDIDGIDGFSDSISFKKVDAMFVTDIDSLQPFILDTIYKPFGVVIRTSSSDRNREISIAIKKKTGYQVFQVHAYNMFHAGDDSITVSRVDFNGKGNKELLIQYVHTSGRDMNTFGSDGWEEGFYIWDADNTTCLAAFKNYGCYTSWWKEFDPNESDSLEYEDRTIIKSGGDSSCTSYRYSLKRGEIIFEKDTICNNYNEGIPASDNKPQRIRYRLGKNALMKLRQ